MKKATSRKQKHSPYMTTNDDPTEGAVEVAVPEPQGGITDWLQRWFVFLTIKQWEAIDAEYRRPDPKAEVKGILTMVVVALMLTLQKYFGNKRFFKDHLGQLVRDWPFPEIWGHIYWSFGCAMTYFVLPALFIHFVLHERVRDYGLSLKGVGRHVPLYILMFLVVLPFVVIASFSSSFLHRYPFYSGTGHSWAEFFLWESAYGFQFVTLEFFFRGFMVLALARYLGAYAVFAMVIPYTMIHFAKPLPECLGAIIAGTTLGTLALRTRSIAGGVCIHVAVAWSMDLLALWQKKELQNLFMG